MTFNHIEIDYPSLSRETVDGVRYYDTPNGKKLVSITSVISHYNREIFREWRSKVGEKEANKVTKQATSRVQICTRVLSEELRTSICSTVIRDVIQTG